MQGTRGEYLLESVRRCTKFVVRGIVTNQEFINKVFDEFATADGKGTDTPSAALKDPKTGQPQSNPARQVWISETALGTALNTSYFAASVGLFAIVMGVALLLTGVGFLVLASGVLGRRKTDESHAAAPAAG